jgi:hypothetical protein
MKNDLYYWFLFTNEMTYLKNWVFPKGDEWKIFSSCIIVFLKYSNSLFLFCCLILKIIYIILQFDIHDILEYINE